MDLKKNSIHTLEIDGYSSHGDGVGHLDGMAIFIKGALKGEVCKISLMKVGKSVAWGRLLQVLSPSPARIEPDCPFYQLCGGCRMRHMTYEEELRCKRQRVDDAFQRISGLDLRVSAIHGAKNPTRYRNKAVFPVGQDQNGSVKVGFYRERSHDIIDVSSCLLQSDLADKAGRILRRWMHKFQVTAYDEATGTGLIRHLFVRTNRRRESLLCVVSTTSCLPFEKELVESFRTGCPKTIGIVLNTNSEKTNVILGKQYRTLWGSDTIEDRLCGLTFQLSVPSFFQVNRDQAEILYSLALEYAGLTGSETVVDLYCGTGTISLVMARKAKKVIGAEIVQPAVCNARENAARNGFSNTEFLCADAGDASKELARRGICPDVISVDPPRKGLSVDVISAIEQMSPKRVVYISCDPATLARDLKLFAEIGYNALRAEAVDMFSRTSHVETVVLLSKGEIDSKKVRVEFSLEDMDMSGFQKDATYSQIKERVLQQTGLKVSSLYISQVKRKCGLDVGQNYNLSKKEDAKVPQCPPEKEAAITEALKFFGMI